LSRNKLVAIGKVGKPFGIKGSLRIHSFAESFDVYERSTVLFLDETPYTVLSVRPHKKSIVADLEGIDTPEAAKELVGQTVRTDASNLPPKNEDEYYWHELIGLRVLTRDGADLGEITSIIETGANDVLQIEGDFGEILLPMIDQVVLEVDTKKGEMIVDPLEGLIPEGVTAAPIHDG
jgi:16S rRNA processing protein RimM